jgi:preprotein translocase subunit SecG
MMIFTWLLTFLLVIDCLILVLLVLIQLPKKEAGMGQAFGGSTTDALFGAGSGTALTKLTKYTAGIFFVATLLLSVLHSHAARSRGGDLRNLLSTQEKVNALPAAKNSSPTNAAATATAGAGVSGAASNAIKLTTPAPAVPAPNTPVEKAK